MYPDHIQNWSDVVHGLFIFLILAAFWLSKTDQICGLLALFGECLGGMAWHSERMSQSGCRHTCDIIFGPFDRRDDLDLICMLTCASTCGHADMCWYVPTSVDICANVCWHVQVCAPCETTLGNYDTNNFDLACIPVCVSTCGCADMCWYVPTCADMCRHVLTCADMFQHVTSFSTPLIPNIWTLFPYGRVSAHMGMPTRADMSRHVPICANL